VKKLIFALLLVVSLVFAASSLYAAGRIFGVKGGLDITKLTGDVENVDWKTGAVGGVFVSWPIGDIFAIQPEALFSMKGAKEHVTVLNVPVDLTVKLTYFEIPVLARLNIPVAGAVRPNVYAGPAIGFKMSAKGSAEANGRSGEEDIEGVKSTDIGLVVGGGLEYKLTSGRLLFDVRYEAGLTSINDTADARDIKNAALSFMVGYGFAF
jgi:hypothetical protein